MTKRVGALVWGAVFAQIALNSSSAFAFTSSVVEDEKNPVIVSAQSILSADSIREIRSANYLVSGTVGNPGFEKKVLEDALYLLGRPDDRTTYKLAQQASVFTHSVSSQEYLEFTQMTDDGYPLEGMGIRVMLQNSIKGLSIRLVDSKFSPPSARNESSVSPNSLLLSVTAAEAARSVLGEVEAPVFRDQVLYRSIGGTWKLVRDIQFEGLEQAAVIDVQTGIAWKEDRSHHERAASGEVFGKGILAGPPRPENKPTDLPMPVMKLDFGNGASAFTDAQGRFSLEDNERASSLKAQLDGKFAHVKNQGGSSLVVDKPMNPDEPGRFEFVAADEFALAQTSAYYHVNQVHAWLNAHGLQNKGFDKTVNANVNLSSTCNAYYSGGSINFFRSGGTAKRTCVNTSYDSVVYHEYGHLVDDAYGGITNGGLSEGWGDIISMYMLGIPEVGKNFFLTGRDVKNYIRSGENDYKFPKDGYDEVHRLGQAWMGFAWKLRLGLIKKYGQEKGAEKAEELILPSLPSNATDIPTALRETLMRDVEPGGSVASAPDLKEFTVAATAHGLEGFLKIK